VSATESTKVQLGGSVDSLADVRLFPALVIFTAHATQYRLFAAPGGSGRARRSHDAAGIGARAEPDGVGRPLRAPTRVRRPLEIHTGQSVFFTLHGP